MLSSVWSAVQILAVHSYFCKLTPWRRQLRTLMSSEVLGGALQCCVLGHKGAIAVLCAWLGCLTSKRNFSHSDWMWYGRLRLHTGFRRCMLLQIGIFCLSGQSFSARPVWVAFLVFLSASSTFFPFRSLGSCYLHNVAGI